MFDFKKIKKNTYLQRGEDLVTITNAGSFYFGRIPSKKLGLDRYKTVDVLLDEEKGVIGFRFFMDESGAYSCYRNKSAHIISCGRAFRTIGRARDYSGRYTYKKVNANEYGEVVVVDLKNGYVKRKKRDGRNIKKVSFHDITN